MSGEKLRGGYTLIQTRMRGEDKNWLPVKDKAPDAEVKTMVNRAGLTSHVEIEKKERSQLLLRKRKARGQ